MNMAILSAMSEVSGLKDKVCYGVFNKKKWKKSCFKKGIDPFYIGPN